MIDPVTRAAEGVERATAKLRAAVASAVMDGAPVADVARRAGVARPTVYRWLRESENH